MDDSPAGMMARYEIVRWAGYPKPTPAKWFTKERLAELREVHKLMREGEIRDDFADDWTPDRFRECQGRSAWAACRLADLGWPLGCLRGYRAAYRAWYSKFMEPVTGKPAIKAHAFLVVRVRHWTSGNIHDLVLDNERRGIERGWSGRGFFNVGPDMGLKRRQA